MEHSPAWGMSPFTVDGAGKTKGLLRDVGIASKFAAAAPRMASACLLCSQRRADTRHVGRDGFTNAKYMIENIDTEGTVALVQNTHT